ncbi:MAG: hypothetical protein V4719_00790 [Planctomycetota bacterium]
MANIGDLVTTLVCDASKYPAGTNTAIESNKALSGSIDSIIGQLQRQRKEFEKRGKTTQDNILGSAAKGASEGQINAALQINEEVEALKKKAAAERDMVLAEQEAKTARDKAAASGAALLTTLREEAATVNMSADELRLYKAELAGVNPVTIAAARAEQTRINGLKNQAKADKEASDATEKNKNSVNTMIAQMEKERATAGMSANQIRIYTLAKAGASEASIKHAQRLMAETDAMNRQAAGATAVSSGLNTQGRRTMMVTEATRGLEDAVAGYTNNGVKGMLMATTNNINQLGSLAGGVMGTALSIGSIAALIGVSLIPKLIEWANDTKAVEAANERLIASNKKLQESRVEKYVGRREREHSTEVMQAQFDQSNAQAARTPRSASAVEGEIAALRAQSQEEYHRMQLEKDRQEMARLQDSRVAGPTVKFKPKPLRDWGGYAGQMVGENTGMETQAEQEKRRKAAEELAQKQEEYRKAEESAQQHAIRLEQMAKQRQKLEAQLAEARRIEALKERADAMAEEQAEYDRETQEHLAKEKRRAAQELEIRKQASNTMMSLIKKGSPQLAEEIEKKRTEYDQRKSVQDALNRGVINEVEGKTVLDSIGRKESVLPGGPAAALQSGTTAAYSSMVKGLQKTQEDKQIAADKANTDRLATILEKIEAREPLQVNVLSV